ncbi:MAG: hypothetical protein NVV60_11840 [Luteimonas sp.]|nr:hypothetical protein [Luteimonas sp.]
MLFILLALAATAASAYLYGLTGLILGGAASFLFLILLNTLIKKFKIGFIPSEVKDQVATDFIAANHDLVEKCKGTYTAYELKELVSSLLERMMEQSVYNSKANHMGSPTSFPVFIHSANELIAKLDTSLDIEVAHEVVSYTMKHPLLFGGGSSAP